MGLDKDTNAMLRVLQTPQAYPHKTNGIKLIETNISWIFLTGKYAYKVKKPVNLGFVNYKTYEKRIFFSNEELRLNRRMGPSIYIGVVGIRGPKQKARLSRELISSKENALNKYIEIAIKMYQFSNEDLLSNVLKKKGLMKTSVEKFGRSLAAFHIGTDSSNTSRPYGSGKIILSHALENLKIIEQLSVDKRIIDITKAINYWSNKEGEVLKGRFNQRLKNGAIRECHGDLHTENIYLTSHKTLSAFDSLEFNPELRWIDPISEIAFLVSDLQAKDYYNYSLFLLNCWLEHTGDYAGMDLWKWYSTYRLVVRAKVLSLKINSLKASNDCTKDKLQVLKQGLDKYFENAISTMNSKPKALIIMHGLSGSGKSFLSKKLNERLGAIRISSDIERQRLFNRRPINLELESNVSLIEKSIKYPQFNCFPYHRKVTNWLFKEWLPYLARQCLNSGYTTIIDATFLKRQEREMMNNLAIKEGVDFVIISCYCNEEDSKQRILSRLSSGKDPSEANIDVYNRQKHMLEELSPPEQRLAIKHNKLSTIEDCINRLNALIKFK